MVIVAKLIRIHFALVCDWIVSMTGGCTTSKKFGSEIHMYDLLGISVKGQV